METIEKLGYLKGLVDGLELDANAKETKAIKAIVDVLDSICEDLDYINEDIGELTDTVDEMDEDLGELEDYVYDDDVCDCCDDEDVEYEVVCPNCGETIVLDEDTAAEGKIDCPNCGEHLELDFEEEESCCCEDCKD